MIKLLIQERFRNDVHYVWCSESCDAATAPAYSFARLTPPSSNPKDIYRELSEAARGGDRHNHVIVRVKAMYVTESESWVAKGEMTLSARDELIQMLDTADFSLWRPLLYIIPRSLVEPRLQVVPPAKRASHGLEYIIPDLARAEFDIVEL